MALLALPLIGPPRARAGPRSPIACARPPIALGKTRIRTIRRVLPRRSAEHPSGVRARHGRIVGDTAM